MDNIRQMREILERDYKNVKEIYDLSLVLLNELRQPEISNEKRNEYAAYEQQLKEGLRELELQVTAERERLNSLC